MNRNDFKTIKLSNRISGTMLQTAIDNNESQTVIDILTRVSAQFDEKYAEAKNARKLSTRIRNLINH